MFDTSSWERLVRETHGSIYGYVRRMLRDDAAAADVTQEVFARAWERRETLDPEGLRPWLFRVALHEVRHVLRDGRRRQEKERAMAERLERKGDRPQADTERLAAEEERQLVEQHLDALPESERSLLTLHFYEGLSQREMATVLEVPRTTVAHRLRKALESLRGRLSGAGCGALLPHVESVMASSPPIVVPPALESSLLAIAAPVVPAGVTSTLTVGGFVMSQKIWVAGIVAAALTFIAGFGAGRGTSPDRSADALEKTTAKSERLAEERDALEDENGKLATQVDRLRKERDALDLQLVETRKNLEEEIARVATVPETVATAEGATAPDAVEWEALVQTIKTHRGAAFKVAELVAAGGGSRDLGPEMQALRLTVIAELEKQAAKAKLETPYPMLDPDYLPKIMETYLDGFLDLDEGQIAEVHELAESIRAAHDLPDDASPYQVYEVRNAVLSEFTERLAPSLSEEQHAALTRLGPVWDEVVSGSYRGVTFGLQADYRNTFLGELRRHYRFEAHHRDRAVAAADSYLDQVRHTLNRFQVPDGDFSALGETQRQQLEREFRTLERRLDEELYGLLSPEERDAIVGQLPLVIHFQQGQSWSLDTERAPGF